MPGLVGATVSLTRSAGPALTPQPPGTQESPSAAYLGPITGSSVCLVYGKMLGPAPRALELLCVLCPHCHRTQCPAAVFSGHRGGESLDSGRLRAQRNPGLSTAPICSYLVQTLDFPFKFCQAGEAQRSSVSYSRWYLRFLLRIMNLESDPPAGEASHRWDKSCLVKEIVSEGGARHVWTHVLLSSQAWALPSPTVAGEKE